MLGRLIASAARNPLGLLGAMTVAAAWGAISVNALWLQSGPHPAPFIGRDLLNGGSPTMTALPPVKPSKRVTEIAPGGIDDADRRRAAEYETAMTRDLQTELAARNFYAGPLDGAFGPQTEAAIRAYERAAGLIESGVPSEALLAHIRLSTAIALPVPPPSPLRETVAGTDPVAALLSQTPPADGAAGVAVGGVASGDPRLKAVQSILADLGYAPGSIDGQLGPSTRRAIEDFEIDRGLPMTGDLSPRLMQELTAVSGVPLD
jgi:peptidoglycan hydrolase-like protein with peptidoglycan-binding domain